MFKINWLGVMKFAAKRVPPTQLSNFYYNDRDWLTRGEVTRWKRELKKSGMPLDAKSVMKRIAPVPESYPIEAVGATSARLG